MVSEKMGLSFYRPVVPSITLIFGKMAFFDNLLLKNGAVDFHGIFRVCLVVENYCCANFRNQQSF